MSYKLVKIPCNKTNYYSTNKRAKSDVKYLVFHYTGNLKDTAIANGNYFKAPNRKASAHSFVDDINVVESVNGLYSAWSVGGGLQDQGSPYRTKGAKLHGVITNSNSFSIELCDYTDSKRHNLTAATRKNATVYAAKKMVEYGIPMDRVYRHFDVTGKLCPLYFIEDEPDWKKFKKELAKEYMKLTKKINKDSGKYLIKMLQQKLNSYDIGKQKILIDGVWREETTEYVLAVWKIWGWNKNGKNSGKSVGKNTMKKLGLI